MSRPDPPRVSPNHERPEAEKHWLVRRATITRLWLGFGVILALTVIANIWIDVHGAFGIDGTFGFFAWYGFLTCVAMIVAAKVLGIFLKRPDTYYDEPDP